MRGAAALELLPSGATTVVAPEGAAENGRPLADLAKAIRLNIQRVQDGLLTVVEAYFAIGRDLIAAKKKAGHGRWLRWLETEFAQSEVWARRLMRGAEQEKAVRAHLERQLSISGTFNFEEAVQSATTTRSLMASTSDEWYSPASHIESVRRVLGDIDLDPASNEYANITVGAHRIFTLEDDGLAQEWHGRVFLNPPYSASDAFVPKLLAEYRAGRTTAAIALLGTRTDTRWFAQLWDFVLCFAEGRLSFYNAAGVGPRPTMGSVFVYLGPLPDLFEKEFAQHGAVVERRRMTA